jgi:hypothetical protein
MAKKASIRNVKRKAKALPAKKETVPLKIVKPDKPGFLERFKSKRPPSVEGGIDPLNPLKVIRIAEARDFVRLHPDKENYWSEELCFVSVPIHGEKQPMLHLIDRNLAAQYLPEQDIDRYRLALATKPHDVFFLCKVPSINLDNGYNATALEACEACTTGWYKVTSRKKEGFEDYKRTPARNHDGFPAPSWPTRSLEVLIEITFQRAAIFVDDHPGLLRLIGAKQNLK